MEIASPADIRSIAWEGDLIIPPKVYAVTRLGRSPHMVWGVPEAWPIADALRNRPGQEWNPPAPATDYWLVRLSFILQEPPGIPAMSELHATLQVRPRAGEATETTTTVYRIYPEALGPRDPAEGMVLLTPKLIFAEDRALGANELGARLGCRKVFVSATSSPVGGPAVTWAFKRQAGRGKGSQPLYAIIAVNEDADGFWGQVDVAAYLHAQMGRFSFVLPEVAKPALRFEVTPGAPSGLPPEVPQYLP